MESTDCVISKEDLLQRQLYKICSDELKMRLLKLCESRSLINSRLRKFLFSFDGVDISAVNTSFVLKRKISNFVYYFTNTHNEVFMATCFVVEDSENKIFSIMKEVVLLEPSILQPRSQLQELIFYDKKERCVYKDGVEVCGSMRYSMNNNAEDSDENGR